MMQDEFPKCPICGSTDGYKSSGIIGKYAKCHKCMAKWQVFEKNKQILELTLHELPKDGSGVYTIVSTKEPLFTIFGTRLPTDFWKDLKLEKKISWEFLSKGISPEASEALIADEEERILYQWEGFREVREKIVVKGNTVETKESELGFLLLSTRRLCWLQKRVRGIWKKTSSFLVGCEIPFEEIKSISGDTGNSHEWAVYKKISVVDNKGENTFQLKYAFLETFRPMVESVIETRRKEIEAKKKKERLHIMLDFSFLKTYMEKGGIIMKVLKCPHCSGSIEFPKGGNKIKCSYCGKTIYAQDIFEKVKNLLE